MPKCGAYRKLTRRQLAGLQFFADRSAGTDPGSAIRRELFGLGLIAPNINEATPPVVPTDDGRRVLRGLRI